MLQRLLSGRPWPLAILAGLLLSAPFLAAAKQTGNELPPVTYERDCPDALTRAVGEVLSCVLDYEGTLVSKVGNASVVYRLYSWFPAADALIHVGSGGDHARMVASGDINSAPNAVTLALADRPDRVFWVLFFHMFYGWVDTPELAQNPEHGEFLVVGGATGKYGSRDIFLGRKTWNRVREPYYDLESYLPTGYRFRRTLASYALDYSTLESTMKVYRPRDAECCPNGGKLRYRLRLEKDSSNEAPFRFALDAARYIPPQSQQK